MGAASVLALAYYLSIRKHRTSTRDADPEGKYDTSADGSAKVRSAICNIPFFLLQRKLSMRRQACRASCQGDAASAGPVYVYNQCTSE